MTSALTPVPHTHGPSIVPPDLRARRVLRVEQHRGPDGPPALPDGKSHPPAVLEPGPDDLIQYGGTGRGGTYPPARARPPSARTTPRLTVNRSEQALISTASALTVDRWECRGTPNDPPSRSPPEPAGTFLLLSQVDLPQAGREPHWAPPTDNSRRFPSAVPGRGGHHGRETPQGPAPAGEPPPPTRADADSSGLSRFSATVTPDQGRVRSLDRPHLEANRCAPAPRHPGAQDAHRARGRSPAAGPAPGERESARRKAQPMAARPRGGFLRRRGISTLAQPPLFRMCPVAVVASVCGTVRVVKRADVSPDGGGRG